MKQLTTKQILDLCKSYSVMFMFGKKESEVIEQITKEYEAMLHKPRRDVK